MNENVPPNSAAKASAAADSARGLPYYEKLRRDLRDTINKKRILDRNMAAIEEQIFRAETAYLEETSAAGNIVKGFDNYIKAAATNAASATTGTISGAAAGGTRRKAAVNDADRVFSKSSVSYNRESETPNSGVSTPANAGTPTGTSFEGRAAGADKKKKKGTAASTADEDDTRSTKRQKISFSRKGGDD